MRTSCQYQIMSVIEFVCSLSLTYGLQELPLILQMMPEPLYSLHVVCKRSTKRTQWWGCVSEETGDCGRNMQLLLLLKGANYSTMRHVVILN